ncbi:protein-tyrosine phosphatase [Perkinsela sp. CCAP 1560/4]|nr:protein-tyrosine phosphatase [Perkinsela sp. CCAP 1560/4]|eukprot:KNH04827.1 protein-tyrosine phosphatase [Perkinsela sp. CCAP 1560/4]
MNTHASNRLKYDAECLQMLRIAASRLRLLKGMRPPTHSSHAPVDGKGHRTVSGQWDTTRKLPGHIFREHKTLHTRSITRRRADEGVQIIDESKNKTPADQSSPFVSDVERSEMLKMRERVKLSVEKGRETQAERTPVAKEKSVVPSSPRVNRRTQPKTPTDAGETAISLAALAHHTLGGKKAYMQEALQTLQRLFGPDWLDIFQFKPYYCPVFVPIPYKAAEKPEEAEVAEGRWSFGRTPEAEVACDEPIGTDDQLRKALEKFDLREGRKLDFSAPSASESKADNPPVQKIKEENPVPIVSCFQVKPSRSPHEGKEDPRMIPHVKPKTKASLSERRKTPKAVQPGTLETEKVKTRTRRQGTPTAVDEIKPTAPLLDEAPIKQKSSANPFSVRKRFIMPIMRSKKFVVWLHVTNHPEPPYEHSYIRPLTGEEERKLRNLVAEIPNRPDPLDPDISEEDYFDRVKEWRIQLDAVYEYVAPKPAVASEPSQNEVES